MPQPSLLSSVSDNLAGWPWLLPEGLLVATLVVVLLLAAWLPQHQRYWLRPVVLTGLALAGSSKYWLGTQLMGQSAVLFGQLLVFDPLALFFSWLFLIITVPVILWPSDLAQPATDTAAGPAHMVLVLGVLSGSCLLVMAAHWLMVYLGLTLLGLASALLLGSQSAPLHAASGLKYMLYGMVTTAFMLWGLSYLYGFTGTLAWDDPSLALRLLTLPGPLAGMILLLCLGSLLFVLGVVPYHFWLPGVYQGARPVTVAYLATAPKLAALAVLWRLSQQYWPQLGPAFQTQAQQALAVLALLTLFVGHAAALLQNSLPRLLAYGTIAQGGLLMAGVVALPGSEAGLLYYSALYAVMNLAAWLGIEVLQYLTGSVSLRDCAGLGRQFPVLGVSLTIVMLALVGLPPTAGFTGKFLLLTGVWEAAQHTGSLLYQALWGTSLLGTVFSLYYYLKLPYVLFATAPIQVPAQSRTVRRAAFMLIGLLALLLLVAFGAGSRLLPGSGLYTGY